MASAGKLPPVGAARLERGAQLMAAFCEELAAGGSDKLSAAGGEDAKANCATFAGWVQTNCFDGITTDEHGPTVRAWARALNKAVDLLCASLQFGRWADIVAEAGGLPASPAVSDSEPAETADAIKVDIKHVRVIIGQGGETIRKMQAETGATIQVGMEADLGDPPNLRTISFLGDAMSAGKAREMVEDLINKDRRYGGEGGMPGWFQHTSEQQGAAAGSEPWGVLIEPLELEEAGEASEDGLGSESSEEGEEWEGDEDDDEDVVGIGMDVDEEAPMHEAPMHAGQSVASAAVPQADEPRTAAAHVQIVTDCFPELSRQDALQLLRAYNYNARAAISDYYRSRQLRERRALAAHRLQQQQVEQQQRWCELELRRRQLLAQQRQQACMRHRQVAARGAGYGGGSIFG